MDTFNIRGIVFRAVDYGETSKILTVYTSEFGLISVMAKGVKTPKSKKQNLVAPFTEAVFELNKSRDFYYLKDGEIFFDNLHIRENLKQIYLTQVFFDIIENTLVAEDLDQDHYLLLSKSMQYFKKSTQDDYSLKVANMFLLKYISMIGYRPNLQTCCKCGKNEFKQVYFSTQAGGILCQDHVDSRSVKLSEKEYQYFNQLVLQVFENIDIIGLGKDEIKIFKIIIDFIIYNLEIKVPRSLTMVYRLLGIK